MTTVPPLPDHPEVVRAHARKLVATAAARLLRVLKLGSPDIIIANQCAILGRYGRRLAPWDMARMEAEHDAHQARKHAGVCTDLSCERPAVHDGGEVEDYCVEHAMRMRTHLAEGRALMSGELPIEDVSPDPLKGDPDVDP